MKGQQSPLSGHSLETSLSELESLLAESSGLSGHSGMVQKLKALQLVEQMIAAQEQTLGSKGDDGKGWMV